MSIPSDSDFGQGYREWISTGSSGHHSWWVLSVYTSQPSSCHIMYVSPRAEIADTMTKALHFNTYGGNPMACAVGSAVLDVSSSCIIVENTDNLNLRQSTLVF